MAGELDMLTAPLLAAGIREALTTAPEHLTAIMRASSQGRLLSRASTAEPQVPAPASTAAGKLPTARAVLAAACATAGLDHTGARLIRFVDNAVFHLAHPPVVVKITRNPRLWHRASTALTAARVLAAHQVPAVRPAAHTTQPVYIGPYAVTFWPRSTTTARHRR